MSVHILEEARRCLNCKNPMCQRGCPIHTPIPNVVQLMLAGKMESSTLVVAVVKLQNSGGDGSSQYNLMMAGTMLAAMPMIILFLCMNKMFVAGITQGAVKG